MAAWWSETPESVIRLLDADHLRRSPASVGGPLGHKEWMHFCVLTDELDFMVNFSLIDTGQIEHGQEVPRVVALAADRDGWDGEVDSYDDSDCAYVGGRVDLEIGGNSMRLDKGEYVLETRSAGGQLAASLRLRPITSPTMTINVAMGRASALRWFVVPRLLASGTVTFRGRTHVLSNAAAYHDHNWGQFRWGDDFSWEWATILPDDPECPWAAVYTRVSDRGRNTVGSEALLLWHKSVATRAFRGEDLSVQSGKLQPCREVPRFPPILRLAVPGFAVDIPEKIEVRADALGDDARLILEPVDMAQIGVPNDGDCRTSMLSEIRCRASLTGSIRNESIQFEGSAILEMTHVAA